MVHTESRAGDGVSLHPAKKRSRQRLKKAATIFVVEDDEASRGGVADRLHQALAAERLFDEVVDPELQRLDRLGDRRFAGDDNGGRKGVRVGEPAHQLDAADARQPDVEKQQVGPGFDRTGIARPGLDRSLSGEPFDRRLGAVDGAS